jgi:hypothetical protein
VMEYLPFLVGLLLVASVSFWNDVKSLQIVLGWMCSLELWC